MQIWGDEVGSIRIDGASPHSSLASCKIRCLLSLQASTQIHLVISMVPLHPFLVLLGCITTFPGVTAAHPLHIWLFKNAPEAQSADRSWLWNAWWGADSSVSVVDRTPPLTFVARPASFGRNLDDNPLL